MKFSELGLSQDILDAIATHGYVEATPIQEKTIPLTLAGKDVIGQAQTGTGKTAAFGLPILEHIDLSNKNIQALIVSPTRELAIQTAEELKKLGRDKHVDVQVVFGGADIRRQIQNLKSHPQILVGTPGRLLDHINRKTVKIDNVKTLVLDEADEMLNMGFLDDIESIIKNTPADRQTLLFSATMPPAIKRIGVKFMTNPEHIQIEAKELTTDLVDQYFVRMRENEKFDTMTRIFDVQAPKLAIVFGRTKRRVEELSRGLEARGYRAAGLHGDLTQQMRSRVLAQFKSHEINILVATDVAARGLDVKDVTHVYNFDIPQDPESYVHRIGRTGRAGAKGVSVTLVAPNEMDYLRAVEDLTKKRMTPLEPASLKEARIGKIKNAADEVHNIVKKTDVSEIQTEVDKLTNQYSSEELAAALLSSVADLEKQNTPVEITRERPLPRRRNGSGSRNGGGRGGDRRGNGGGYRGGNRSGGSRNGGGNRERRGNSERRFGDYKRRDGRSNEGRSNNSSRQRREFTVREKD
ncbi:MULTISPECIES: DEAD/DEAH box helicase [Leuconostoc]|uniref:DEAD-box ATP-dependent RNA helicase CshA n=2 Tax=Leuconostoc citreum TaxID=33964 RepID=B1MXE7_LEUCK|nr:MULTISPECIES: DEAD/DEAH box helicase [Leuconostoc]ACA82199.1 Putative ATP-dependent RNA helicase [Leuconostoc citreum KM20]KAF0260333.1 ATP-dependent helicase [Leuconostoc citreum]MCS8584460.1 DEAD/DEAH box helicase [Leuconostoc citreum]MCS8587370.1 DEAD/DEAH box helicase [Leuconostoc citreum]MCS8595116.1 DEAD/DEAH box helicase [Leuconostoc citreum]